MVYAVIMAGGSGTRFWPKSTKKLPKQFLSLFGEGTMIQNTARRIEPIIPQERILVITNDDYVDIVKDQLPSIPADNVVGEPVAKNTAPCVAIAAEMLYKKDPEAVMVVLPADHHIQEPEIFNEFLKAAIEKAGSGENLVTIGINPDRPETGYGYIHGDDSVQEEYNQKLVHPVKAFKEKPDEATAQQFLVAGDYYWNSGMFIWSVSTILNEFKKYLPDMYDLVKKSSDSFFSQDHKSAVDSFYRACESVSIDYGIMEHAENVFLVPAEFGWNDVGSWTAAYELGNKDSHGNVINTKHATFSESTKNYISSKSGKMISIVGVDGIAVVETDDAILVCKLDKAQNVKEIVDELKSNEELKKFL
ncbi:MAG TPA: mannose-1-phosphate guanylyltransferase [Gracilimonas sp.]|uniref:mannose-1-phosphate guanylyltransferase n=1 Tax=Gracilimonas sp. TaxID=1974203 RepID=UPI002D8CA9F6|nr:mannose-1-phosphate guanylyltransferase [Gracilimonas sp.]